VTLRNLLAAKGYGSLDAVREEAREEGREEGREEEARSALLATIAARGWALDDANARRVADCRDLPTLRAWTLRAVTAASLDAVLTPS